MEKICMGIDVSKDYLDCCLGKMDALQNQTIIKKQRLKNEDAGFKEMLEWQQQHCSDSRVLFVMEATGVYYENLAFYLSDVQQELSVLLPNAVKYYSRSINVKTKTDGKDSEVLCKLGLERKLTAWQMPTKIMRDLKFLTREYRDHKTKLTQSKNQLHAYAHSHQSPASTQRRLHKQIALLEAQVLEIEAEIRVLVISDTVFSERVQKICTIPGISFITSVCIIAETNGFSLIKNAKQLVSYAGLDIQQNQSGQKQGKSRISKKGNRFIRLSLYMPAMCASRYNPIMKRFYDSLSARKEVKKVAITAVARKLLVLIYTLWKQDQEFNPEYELHKKVDKLLPVYAG